MKEHPSFYVYVIVDRRNPEPPIEVFNTRAMARDRKADYALEEGGEQLRVRRAKLTIFES